MHTNHEPIDPDVLSEMGYERRDVNYGSLTRWIVAFFGLAVVFFFVAWLFYRWLAPVQVAQGNPNFVPKTRRVPPAPNPLLQNNVETKVDIQRMRQDEVTLLTSYGWVDQGQGVVRIPIERAKELIAQRGASAATGPANVGPIPRADASPRDVTGGAPADKAPGGANLGDTSPRTRIPTGKSTQDQDRNGGVTNAPTGSDSSASNSVPNTNLAPSGTGETGPTNGARE